MKWRFFFFILLMYTPAGRAAEEVSQALQNVNQFRDPFKAPLVQTEGDLGNRSPLEQYALNDFRLLGVMSGPVRKRAMLGTPDGKTHIVAERMALGTRSGLITRITTRSVIVREKVMNAIGEEENVETELTMNKDNRGTNAL